MIGVLLFIVLVTTFFLYMKTLRLQRKVDQSLSQEQLETALDAFIVELKADNEALMEQLNGVRTNGQENTRSVQWKIMRIYKARSCNLHNIMKLM